jgi:nicotinate-nucleotide adenylyltransferase
VHAGHIQLGRDALARLALAAVVYVPAGQPWQKEGLAPAEERLRMLEIALAGFPKARIDRREIDRPGPTYTVETLRELRAELGPRQGIVWILGEDQLQRLDTWNRWQEIVELAHLAHARRPGAEATLPPPVARMLEERRADALALRERACGAVVAFEMQAVDCSASRLRRALARAPARVAQGNASGDAFGSSTGGAPGARPGDLASRMLPPGVLEYILSRNLYGARHGTAKTATIGH